MRASKTAAPRYRLNAHAPDEHTRIEVLDGNMRPVKLEHNLGDVSLQLPAGVYSVRFYQGQNFTEKLAALMPEMPVADVSINLSEEPDFATAAPVPNTTTTHEWQSDPARKLSLSVPKPPLPGHAGGSHFFLFLRNPFEAGVLPHGVTLHDLNGVEIFDLDQHGEGDPQAQWIGAHLDLDPGAYRLRLPPVRGSFSEQILFTVAGWQTQVFMMTAQGPERQQEITRISILMAKGGLGFDFDRPDSRLTEAALRALGSQENIPGAVRSEMLWAKFENPMLGIYAGLLHLRRARPDPHLTREVFNNLLRLVGPLPDVLAIGWALALRDENTRADASIMTALRNPAACAIPPMLRESWDHLLRASVDERELIPRGSISDRIGGRLVGGTPWVAWLGDLPAPRAAPALVETVAAKTSSAGGLWGILSGAWRLIAGATGAALLPKLAEKLSHHPEARFWLQTPRFTDLERRVAYWLQPALDPRFAGACEAYPEFARKLRSAANDRTTDEATLLAELNLGSTTALGAALGIYYKLFTNPVIPDATRLETFVTEESQQRTMLARLLRRLAKKPSHIHQVQMKRRLNLLEFIYLYYRGSPADGTKAELERLASRLCESGFVFDEKGSLTPADVAAQQSEVQQELIRELEAASMPRGFTLPQNWQARVLPTLQGYTKGELLPLLERKASTRPRQKAPPTSQGGIATAGQNLSHKESRQ
ncbi:MAG: hypothetical protein V7609_2889 [Verrucomicrobiota bacterium]